MNTLRSLSAFIALVIIATLAGCDYLIQQHEIAEACNEKDGGSQRACDNLNRHNRYKAEDAQRDQSERWKKESNANAEIVWRNELSLARREDLKAIKAKYPKFGWMSGIWCGFQTQRIEIVAPGKLRRIILQRFYKSGYPTSSSLKVGRAHIRTKGDEIEWWGSYSLMGLGKYAIYQTHTIRKRAADKFIITSNTHLKSKSHDPNVPFSGVTKKVYRLNTEYRRCTHDPAIF